MNIHTRLRERREQMGYTQSEIAAKVGVKPQAVQQWEDAGPRGTLPRRDKRRVLAQILAVHPLWFENDGIDPTLDPNFEFSTAKQKRAEYKTLDDDAAEVARAWSRLPPANKNCIGTAFLKTHPVPLNGAHKLPRMRSRNIG